MGNNYYDRRNRFTDKQLVDCYLKYDSQIKAAKELGCSRETVARAVRRAGIKMSGQLHNGSSERKCCGSPMKVTDKQLIESAKTMTSKEIAEKYSVHITRVQVRCKRLGIKPVGYENGSLSGLRKNWGKKNDNLKNKGGLLSVVWHYVPTHDKAVKKNCPDFKYLESKGRKVRLKCKKCGFVVERDRSTIRRYHAICEICSEKERREKELREAQIKTVRFLIALKESKTPRKCLACGEEFTSPYPNQLYCSDGCRNKGHNKRIPKEQRVDKISLKRLYKRDKGICYLCGRSCDFNDWNVSKNGNPYPGDNYPTIDHVIPVSKGGLDAWDNVKLAHWKCNLIKSDKIVIITPNNKNHISEETG